jgi:hypothetical protein
MKVKHLKERLLRLPTNVEFTLFLIREELKSSRLFYGLGIAGFDHSIYRSDFSTLIQEAIGLDTDSNEINDFYFQKLTYYTERVDQDQEKITNLAFKFYLDLEFEKRRRLTRYPPEANRQTGCKI